MQICREYPQCRISLLKILHILIKYLCSKLSILGFCSHIILIPDLQNDLMECFLLLTSANFFIVIINITILSALLFVIPGKGFIK